MYFQMHGTWLHRSIAWVFVFCSFARAANLASDSPASPEELAQVYRTQVDRQLAVPVSALPRYAELTEEAFAQAAITPGHSQYVVVIDRSPVVQALLLLWRKARGEYVFVGASPVSTGRPGGFDHFMTPLGVFDHTPANPDFRAEGTFNRNGVRGYGIKGMRVFDLGWQPASKGWGDGALLKIRLQMHATDPDFLEWRLGSAQSKGCIRIPSTLNQLFDQYGVIDAAYDEAELAGAALWVLRADRRPVAGAGRYIVIVDSAGVERPDWSPVPRSPGR